jgi:type II secretory pathway component GspD/PulD (secretin)
MFKHLKGKIMTGFKKLFFQTLKIAAVAAIVCICVNAAMGQSTPAAPVPPDAQPKNEKPAKASQTPAEDQDIKIFYLKYCDPELMIQVLNTVIKGGRSAIDKRTNSIIISASNDQMKTADAILRMLDIPYSEKDRSMPVNVRIYWLVDGEASAAQPVASLKEIVEDLHIQGLKNIGQLAQTMVRSQYDGQFHISCSPLLDNKTVMLSASGQIQPGSRLNVRIRASKAKAEGSENPTGNLVELDVNTVYEDGKYIVLAVAPIGKITSVFVIQITEGKP